MAVFNIHIHALDLSAFLVFSAPPVFSARPETSYGAVACLATCKRRPGSSQPTPEYVVDKKNGICTLDEDLEDSSQTFEGS